MNAERTNPNGVRLQGRMAGLDATLCPDRLPFFIEWPGGQGNPELEGVPPSAGHGIEWVEVGGDEDRLRHWVGGDTAPLVTVGGAPGVRRFSLSRGGETLVVDAR